MLPLGHRMDLFDEHFFAGLSVRLAALHSQGIDIIRLDEGAPDLPPAPHIIEALVRSARQPDAHRYQPASGIPVLRQAWAEMYQRIYGVNVDPDREVLPLIGSKEGIVHLPLAFINPGDVVLVPNPGYVTYTRGTRLVGGEPYYLALQPEMGFLPDLETVPEEILGRTKLLWLNYPNNPTSATASLEFFTTVVAFAQRHKLIVCHDAAYSQVTFDGYHAPSLLELPGAREVCVEFNTLSKSHNMAGWRVAALIGNAEVIKAVYMLKTNLDSGHFKPVMEAAVAAMTGDQSWLQTRNEIYRQRRDVVLQTLHRLGWKADIPHASLYVWFAVPDGQTSANFTNRLLEQAHVSLTPGSIFGSGGEGYVRLSLTAPTEGVQKAMLRLEKYSENTPENQG